jgi:hypothetical protein
MASLLIEARDAASAARLAAQTVLDPAVLDDLVTATGNSPPPGWPTAFTAGPRPRRTPAASPAGSSASKTSSSALPPGLEPAGYRGRQHHLTIGSRTGSHSGIVPARAWVPGLARARRPGTDDRRRWFASSS